MFARNIDALVQAGERGAVLAVCLIILALLSLLGVAALNTTDTEMMISANERDHKEAFYYADGGTGVGSTLLEQAIELGESPSPAGFVMNNTAFFMDDRSWENSGSFNATNSSFSFYHNGTQGTFVRIGGEEGYVPGSAAQITFGYKGVGKGAGSGGGRVDYLIRSHRAGARNSAAEIDVEWRHITN